MVLAPRQHSFILHVNTLKYVLLKAFSLKG